MTLDTTVAQIAPITDIEPISRWANRPRKTNRKNPKLLALNNAIRAVLALDKTGFIPHGVTELFITDGNGKTGPAFTLPEGLSCPGKTKACAKTCYLAQGQFTFPTPRNSRNRNFAYAKRAIKRGTIVEEMIRAIRLAKSPTIRVHDGGDFFNAPYIKAWVQIVRQTPDITYWAYTRSWSLSNLLKELVVLGRQPNMALWLSVDHDNYLAAMTVWAANRSAFAGLAFMQLEGDEELVRMLTDTIPTAELVIFPYHVGGGKIHKGVVMVADAPNCPAITKEIPHDNDNPACLVCKKCLPTQGEAA